MVSEVERYGDDTPPLFSQVRDQPYSNGCITSQARTMSAQYIEFLKRNREASCRQPSPTLGPKKNSTTS